MKVTIEQAMKQLSRSKTQVYMAIRLGRIKKHDDGTLCSTSVLRYKRDHMRNTATSMPKYLLGVGLTAQELSDASGFTIMALSNFYNNKTRDRRKAFDLLVKGLLAVKADGGVV